MRELAGMRARRQGNLVPASARKAAEAGPLQRTAWTCHPEGSRTCASAPAACAKVLTAGSRSRAHASTFAIATASAASARTTKAAAPEPASAASSGMLRCALRESITAQRVPPASSCSAARAK